VFLATVISRKKSGYLCEQRKNPFSGATADTPPTPLLGEKIQVGTNFLFFS